VASPLTCPYNFEMGAVGLEPTTFSLKGCHSTIELHPLGHDQRGYCNTDDMEYLVGPETNLGTYID
jgi:hypothetical protein